MPNVDGNNTEYLSTDGAGTLAWTALASTEISTLLAATTVGSVGTASHIAAGHLWETDEGGSSDLAYYKFASGDMLSDEEGTYDLTAEGTPTTQRVLMELITQFHWMGLQIIIHRHHYLLQHPRR